VSIRWLTSVVALVSVALGLATVPAQAMPAEPGASGIGDRYFPQDGNGGYNVVHYDIHDTYRLRTGGLRGWTDVTARATENLSRFDLDLVLTPTAVSVDGQPASWTKPSRHELVVTPGRPLKAGTRFTVRVRYHGTPRNIGVNGEFPWIDSDQEAMATNEPHIAPWWFPANDHPRDKAAFDVTVRVARGNQVIGNGDLVSRSTDATWSTWHYRMRQPISTYLAFFAAGRFTIERGTTDSGLPYTLAVSANMPAQWQTAAMRLMRRTPGIVAWEAGELGPYPFTSTGGVTTGLFSGFALENATRPTYPFMGAGASATSTVVHELAHQWFGDDVSVYRWRDVWLNEGFASWVEWRYAETHGGVSAQTKLLRHYREHAADSSFWKVEVGAPGPAHLFDNPVYERGAMALQALRHRIGRARFSTLLHSWVRRHAGGNATVGQFRALAEHVSGQNLDGFFRAWLFSPTKPARSRANGLR
jgi:aminopeptidase N